ncbi:phosphotriesterase family protein [Flavitalea antarctica]
MAAICPGEKLLSNQRYNMFAGSVIPTATGSIDSHEMGITSLHEHIALQADPNEKKKSIAFAISELNKAKALGLKTIVDVNPQRDVAGIREVSLATGINVICCTGYYVLTPEQQSLTVEACERHMTREIEEGIQGSGIRPGVIKIATKRLPITEAEKNLFIAAARIHRRYKLPICTHAVSGCVEQQKILEDSGADLAHCYFSHTEATFGWEGRSVTEEIDYLETITEKGSTLSFNNFGNWNHTKPGDLAQIIRELCKRGYDRNMVATMDLTWKVENGEIKILWGDTNVDGNDRTYSYLLRKAVPWMKEQGISDLSINKFLVDNPARIFTW